jgi:hypothetical protein
LAVVLDDFNADRGTIDWNGKEANWRMREPLGPVRWEGSCWINNHVRVCAWGQP